MDCLIEKVEVFLRRWRIIGEDNNQFVRQRIGISIGYTVFLAIALVVISFAFWNRIVLALSQAHGLGLRLGFASFFGLLGLTTRSWSFLNQGESPIPPYVATYPCIVFFACVAFSAVPLSGATFYIVAPLVCFCLGYMPMDIYETVKDAIRKRPSKD